MAKSAGEKAAAPEAKPGRSKLMLIAAAAAVILLGGGAASYFLFFHHASAATAPAGKEGATAEDEAGDKASEAGSDEGESGDGGSAAAKQTVFVDMPDILVNLQPDAGRMRLLRLRVALEVGNERTAEAVKTLTPRVLDSFQMYLRALTVADVQGSAGMQRLKEEMIARVNLALEPKRVRDVLFKEILVQ